MKLVVFLSVVLVACGAGRSDGNADLSSEPREALINGAPSCPDCEIQLQTLAILPREELEQMGSIPVAFAVDRLPRTSVRRVRAGTYRVVVRGCPSPRGEAAVYLDGYLVFRPGDPPTEFFDLSTSEIEAVEICPGPATLPGEFARLGVSCAVVIWTRRGG